MNFPGLKKQCTRLFITRGFIVAIVAIVALVGCGVSTDTGTPADTPTFIYGLTINDSVGPMVPIDFGDADSVSFKINWDVSSSDPYSVTVSLSDDASVSFDDQTILETNCGSSLDLVCRFLGEQTCGITLGSQTILECSNGTATIDSADITMRLQAAGFPTTNLTNYIVFTVCNEAMDSCLAASVLVEIQDSSP